MKVTLFKEMLPAAIAAGSLCELDYSSTAA